MHVRYVYWFAYYNPDLPSVRYRAKYPLEHLRRVHGVDSSVAYPGYDIKSVLHFMRMYFSALFFRKKDSVIVIQKLYTNRVYALALKLLVFCRRKNTQYDLDDAEYLVYPPRTIHFFMKYAAACSAGSAELLRYAKARNPDVFMLTSPVIAHGKRKRARSELFTAGWIGCYGGAHRECLERDVFPAVERLPFAVKLVLLGVMEDAHEAEIRARFAAFAHVTLEIPRAIDWLDEAAVYERIAAFDVGLSPLLDIEMHRSKSAFKLKQYFSCGVPAIGSAIGENARFLHDGENGFACDDAAAYTEALVKFKEMDAAAYERFSTAAHECVNRFNLDEYCTALLAFYREGKTAEAAWAIPETKATSYATEI